ncbi:hypothetical protein AYO45_06990 [Gammaproteobacteria bacterium SCGC AG-212-F23]|nr:hypothetical protein AYO45_06990 [Gammaproteobacteria bacterium SCGC AG-212-F23]
MYSNTHYLLALTHMPLVGPVKVRRWLEFFSTLENLFSASTTELRRAGLHRDEISLIKNPDWPAVEKDLAWIEESPYHFIVTQEDPYYPLLLREISGAPLVLYVSGNPEVLSLPQIAIVGSRNPSTAGMEIAYQFAECLAVSGFVMTSGLALGIDAACHRGALAVRQKTIAVLGSGLRHIYPDKHFSLAKEIQEQGALVSEFFPDTKAVAKHFPRRNRIISGLSLGVVVVEAAMHSGSLITARFASEQGREVFALPGSIHNPMARGCHHLIREGAKLVETATHIVEELRAFLDMFPGSLGGVGLKTSKKNLESPAFLDYIGYEPTALDTLVFRSGLTASKVSSILLGLELEGYVRAVAGGYERIN